MNDAPLPPVLIVTVYSHYVAPARMPRDLKAAGFRVAVLAPHQSLVTRTRYADRIDLFPDDLPLEAFLRSLGDAVRETRPRLILPGDDIVVRLMMQTVLAFAPRGEPGAAALVPLIVESLGDPRHYATSIDKTVLSARASKLGIAVADGGPVRTPSEGVRVADALGYPVMVRAAIGSAGRGATRCSDAAEVREAIDTLPPPEAWDESANGVALVQRYLTGKPYNRASASWRGREIAGVSRSRIVPDRAQLGAGTVSRYEPTPAIAEANRALLADLAVTGFTSTQFILDEATGRPSLIEVNRRMTPATHTGRRVGVDLASALASAVAGRPWDGPLDLPPERATMLALFPQEFFRDRGSAWLEDLPNDAPWDDPELFAAMLRLGELPP